MYAASKDIPKLSGTIMMTQTRRSFQDTIRQNVAITATIYVGIAVPISIRAAYNSARIQLSERARKLASLRNLGSNRAKVSYVLVGELMLLAVLAQHIGCVLGQVFTDVTLRGFSSALTVCRLFSSPQPSALPVLSS